MLTMLGLDATWLPLVTFATGIIAIGYSSIGGLRAVVITDLLQFLLLFGGAVLVIATVTYRLGGFDWIPTRWNASWDTQPLAGAVTVRVTVVGSVVYGVLWWVCTAGSDQTAIQRFMSTRDARSARRSFLFNAIAGLAVSCVLAMFVKFSTERGAILGSLASLLTAGVVAYWYQLTGLSAISFQWILPFSLAAGIVAGCVISAGTSAG